MDYWITETVLSFSANLKQKVMIQCGRWFVRVSHLLSLVLLCGTDASNAQNSIDRILHFYYSRNSMCIIIQLILPIQIGDRLTSWREEYWTLRFGLHSMNSIFCVINRALFSMRTFILNATEFEIFRGVKT